MTDAELGWIAGIIDGEGTITLTKYYSKTQNGYRYPTLTVTSTDYGIIQKLLDLVEGASMRKAKKEKPHHKQAYDFEVSYHRALKLIILIAPHLAESKKRKRAQYLSDNYLKVTVRSGKYTEEQRLQKELFEKTFFELE